MTNRDADQDLQRPSTSTSLDRAGAPASTGTLWLAGLGAPAGAFDKVVVRRADFVRSMAAGAGERAARGLAAWLTWHVLTRSAPLLRPAFVDENFDFYGRTLSGQPENRERWKRGVSARGGVLGEAVGQLYAERWFPPAAKARMQELVGNLVEAFRRSSPRSSGWGQTRARRRSTSSTRSRPKIGYPDVWRDYSALEIDAGRPRRQRAPQHGLRGRPQPRQDRQPDRPQRVVHAAADGQRLLHPAMNEIVFPAAILQPPFFDLEADDAVNYGGIGAVIGHELGHGFDDQGSRYDGTGALRDWWTEADRERFDARADGSSSSSASSRPCRARGAQGQRRLDRRREHRRPRRPADRLLRLPHRDRGRRAARARRLHRTAALLHRVGAGLAGQGAARPRRSGCSPSTRTRRRTCAATPCATSTSSTRRSASGGDGMWLDADQRVRIF